MSQWAGGPGQWFTEEAVLRAHLCGFNTGFNNCGSRFCFGGIVFCPVSACHWRNMWHWTSLGQWSWTCIKRKRMYVNTPTSPSLSFNLEPDEVSKGIFSISLCLRMRTRGGKHPQHKFLPTMDEWGVGAKKTFSIYTHRVWNYFSLITAYLILTGTQPTVLWKGNIRPGVQGRATGGSYVWCWSPCSYVKAKLKSKVLDPDAAHSDSVSGSTLWNPQKPTVRMMCYIELPNKELGPVMWDGSRTLCLAGFCLHSQPLGWEICWIFLSLKEDRCCLMMHWGVGWILFIRLSPVPLIGPQRALSVSCGVGIAWDPLGKSWQARSSDNLTTNVFLGFWCLGLAPPVNPG